MECVSAEIMSDMERPGWNSPTCRTADAQLLGELATRGERRQDAEYDTAVVADREGSHSELTAERGPVAAATGKRVTLVSMGRGPSDPRAMYKEARFLARCGYEVTYVCNAASGPMVTDDHVHIDALKMPTSRLARQMHGPSIVLREALRSLPEVVHVFDPALIGPAIRLGRRYGVKIVVDLPEDTAKQILQKSYLGPVAVRRVISRAYQRLSQQLLPQVDLVIAATPSIAESLPAGCHHIIVRNFPAIAEIDTVPPLGLSSSKSPARVLRVVYVGGISSIRGVRELVLAAGMMRGAVEVHLAGPAFDSRFLDELESMPGWQHCHYHGWLDWPGSIALIKTCDVGACVLQAAPNQVEALPVKVFEYMACGRGSIVSSFPLWRRLFVGAALFVDPTEPSSIARLMEQLLVEPALLRRLSERGRVLAETRYSWESEAQRLESGYAGLWSVTQE
jgi:glycosyltransferase involved in cell wall biosynthesis